jgi:adenylate kinase
MKPRAILLLGPTGAGKSPLGEMFKRRGLGGARCIHFDFGRQLRRIVAQADAQTRTTATPQAKGAETFAPDEIELLRRLLRSGALLEDEQFPIAERILRAALARSGAGPRAWVVLNGLPRHVGQAEAVGRIVDVRAVVRLDCPPETVAERICSNAGGDRARRCDDRSETVRDKLATYEARTAPLVEHYRRRGVRLITLAVAATTTAEQMWGELATAWQEA